MKKTKVLFLYNEKNQDLFAYFPNDYYNKALTPKLRNGYSSEGQHSGVHEEYAQESIEATPKEYESLKKELEDIGYNLQVMNKPFKQNEPNIYDYTLSNIGKNGLKIKFNTQKAKNLFVLSARKNLSTNSLTIDKKSESDFIAWAISHNLKLEIIN